MSLNREAILASNHLKTEIVDVPEFGGQVTIRELTAAKARELFTAKDDALMPVMWVIASVVNDDGTPAFTKADIALFDNMSQAGLRRISDAAIRLNGLAPEATEEPEKNSEAGPISSLSIG